MQLNISDQDARILRDVLNEYISDLRMEIVDTDQMDFREQLKQRKQVLRRFVEELTKAGNPPAP